MRLPGSVESCATLGEDRRGGQSQTVDYRQLRFSTHRRQSGAALWHRSRCEKCLTICNANFICAPERHGSGVIEAWQRHIRPRRAEFTWFMEVNRSSSPISRRITSAGNGSCSGGIRGDVGDPLLAKERPSA